jgi:cation:H+ antiporter
LRGGITLFDAAFLVTLFGVYVYLASRGEIEEESSLVGPAETIAALPTGQRRAVLMAMFVYAGGAILVAAEPFAEGLIHTGVQFGIDEFQLVQWVAPLASEFPEFLVAGLLAWRMRADAALGALVSSKVNQWTLLIGMLPIAFAISGQTIDPLPTDERQAEELLLTAAQSLLAVVLLINLRMSVWEAGALLFLFLAQFFTPHSLVSRDMFSYAYLGWRPCSSSASSSRCAHTCAPRACRGPGSRRGPASVLRRRLDRRPPRDRWYPCARPPGGARDGGRSWPPM